MLDGIAQLDEPTDIDVTSLKLGLGTALRAADRCDEAIEILAALTDELEATVGPDHPDTLSIKSEYATCLQYQDRLKDMVPTTSRNF